LSSEAARTISDWVVERLELRVGGDGRGPVGERAEVALPARVELARPGREPGAERLAGALLGLAALRAEADGEGHRLLLAAVEGGPGALVDVALLTRVEAAQLALALELPPRVAARALVAGRGALEPRGGGDGGGRVVVPRDQLAAAVVVPVVTRRGVGEHVELELAAGQRLELHAGEHRRSRGVGDPRLGHAPAGRLRGLREGERARGRLHAGGDARGDGLDVVRVVLDRLARHGALVDHGELEPAEGGRALRFSPAAQPSGAPAAYSAWKASGSRRRIRT
jgi:hypothetical protein